MNMKNFDESPYKYEEWSNTAILDIIKKVLITLEAKGLYKDIHFYITFNTMHPLVELPDFLKKEYPESMTIVLQNHFSNFKTSKNGFNVGLTFASIPVTLFVPWDSITSLLDPISPISLSISNNTKTSLNKNTEESSSNKVIKFPKK